MSVASWISFIPLILMGVQFAEKLIVGQKQGEVKKSVVLGMAELFANGMAQSSSGGQKETWEAIKPLVGQMVDVLVSFCNAVGWFSIQDDMANASFEMRKAGLL